MAQGSKQVQTQAQAQLQTLSPQQILVVKLLELPAVELEDRVRAEILENPALEEGRDETTADDYADGDEPKESLEDGGDTDYDSLSDYRSEDDIPDYKLQEHNRSRGERAEEIPFSDVTSFYELLMEQLREQKLEGEQREVAEYLVGSLDDDGLLRKPLETIADELAIYSDINTTPKHLQEVLAIIQTFDPPGVGARSLEECLAIQLHRKIAKALTTSSVPRSLQAALRIMDEAYDDFSHKRWYKLTQKTGMSEDEVQAGLHELCKLNPRPGAALGEVIGRNMQQIVPDFIVETDDEGGITMTLNNSHVPELRMSRDFSMLVEEHTKNPGNQSRESKEALMFLRQKMDAAQGFIDAIRTRQHTLTVTMQAIIELQRPFFLEGDESLLKPMILRDVAERAGLDISTVSRVSNSKYVQTNYGIYPLKFFFSDSYVNPEGEEMSIRRIREAVLECIAKEDKNNPLNDDQLAEKLAEKGFPMARRTVAKYRQQLNIPVARLRAEKLSEESRPTDSNNPNQNI